MCLFLASIKSKIIALTIAVSSFGLLCVSTLSCALNYKSSSEQAENSLVETVKITADRTYWEIQSYLHVAEDLGLDEGVINSRSDSEIQNVLSERAAHYDLERCNLIDKDGKGIDGNDYNDRNYFQEALKGSTCISNPLISKVTGKLTTIIAAPLWEDPSSKKSMGCVYVVPHEEFMNDIIRSIKVSDNCSAYIVNTNGQIIASNSMDDVKNEEIISDFDKIDISSTTPIRYRDNENVNMYAISEPLGINDWYVVVKSPVKDFLVSTYSAISFVILTSAITIAFGAFIAVRLGSRIGKRISDCSNRLKTFSEGDLHSDIPEITANDETKTMAESSQSAISALNNVISDIRRILDEMARGNLTVDINKGASYYIGDLAPLLSCIKNIKSKLIKIMIEISSAGDHVAIGSENVAQGAQALSQGAVEQAASIDELSLSLKKIANRVSESADDCLKANGIVSDAFDSVSLATEKVSNLSSAMDQIADSSNEITKIIKTIDDLAFQTKILALNASIEAARAGAAGKGFSVVADEVGNLASKSAEAAALTATLVENVKSAIAVGSKLSEETQNIVTEVNEKTSSVQQLVNHITEASQEQSEMLEKINVGITEVSTVVQSNSATAEESAATSEELSSQAALLKNKIKEFKIK